LFWLFFAGSVVLFKNMLNKIKNKEAWILTGLYTSFFFGLVFSRYAPHPFMFDGENFISKFLYIGFALLLIIAFAYYSKKYKNKDNSFDKIDSSYLFLISLLVVCLLSVRSAVRLIMVLAPITAIFLGYLIVAVITKFKQTKDETGKIIMGAIVILILLLSFFVFFGNPINKTPGFYQQIKSQAYNFVPSSYNQQWQKAMKWIREETPEDAVFAHWWDYGYWVQTGGERATVTDGGNRIVLWNHFIGRHLLTAQNQSEALELANTYTADYLLIITDDIGKYGAYSTIGADIDYDRFSWITNFKLDQEQTIETRNDTVYLYRGNYVLDDDFIYDNQIYPAERVVIGGILLPVETKTKVIKQPTAVLFYNGKRTDVPLKCIYINNVSCFPLPCFPDRRFLFFHD